MIKRDQTIILKPLVNSEWAIEDLVIGDAQPFWLPLWTGCKDDRECILPHKDMKSNALIGDTPFL